ncbi:unnamed protein product [Polarella glacialis]|uniref:ABC1 atypical kinase-like domain-containing protein n=1 Tax=Polarella glacialis TaxID=89957 RepID=A0A813KH04_POLGL|nr:unnamed protein product [Polarella glacialis]
MPAPDMMMGMGRSMVTMMQFNEAKQDYTNSVANLDEDSAEYNSALLECHKRGADRCVKVASMHRGLYVKAAQFIASIRGGTGERGVPKPFIDALSVFTDQAPHKPISQIVESLKESMKLGSWPAEPLDKACDLKSIEEEPIAAASIAQVHRALLQDGTPVAVKVQYPELRKEMASDFAIFKTMGAQIKQMSGGYDLMWVVEDFEKNLSRELDFRLEAASCEETGKQLAHLSPSIYVPKVFHQFSSSTVLVMEFCDGLIKCTDPAGLRAAGLDVEECAQLICDTFAEMIFVHGRVHADPHAGNIYLRPIDEGGRRRPQLVLLDHGLYYDLRREIAAFSCHSLVAGVSLGRAGLDASAAPDSGRGDAAKSQRRAASPAWGAPACISEECSFREEALAAFDEHFEEACDLVAGEALRSAAEKLRPGLEGQLAQELLERQRADLLYLAVVRDGEQWLQLAKTRAMGVYLPVLSQEVRSAARRAVVNSALHKEFSGGCLDSYFKRKVDSYHSIQPDEGLPFYGVLDHLEIAIKQSLFDVGGASGLPDRNRTAAALPLGLTSNSPPTDEEEMEKLFLMAQVMDNTRVAQADVYLGHVFFGISLRRLARRFQLQRMAGLLPPVSEISRLRATFGFSATGQGQEADDARQQLLLAGAQFESFLESVVRPTEDQVEGLQQALSLSSAALAAARRHTDAVFGRGLREEIFKALTRASQASASAGEASNKAEAEVLASFLLEAAAKGELRMLSAGPEARERLLWDGVLFGALLQDAEDLVATD